MTVECLLGEVMSNWKEALKESIGRISISTIIITSGLTETFCNSSQLESISAVPRVMCCISQGPTHPEPIRTSPACRPGLSSGSQRVSALICFLTSGTLGSPDALRGHSSPSDSGKCWDFCQGIFFGCLSPSSCWWLSGCYLDYSLSDLAGLLKVSGWTSDKGHEESGQKGPGDHFYFWEISP